MDNNIIDTIRRTFLTVLLFSAFVAVGASEPDVLPAKAVAARASQPISQPVLSPSMTIDDMTSQALNLENLLNVLDQYGVKEPAIVAAQAVLETGYFTSDLCQQSHNLFGLRHPSDGSYYTFNKWEESVKAYLDDVQYKYAGGDYYKFLDRIGYAEDKQYTKKVRRVVQRLF